MQLSLENSKAKRRAELCVQSCRCSFCSKTNEMHNISTLFYFGTTLYTSDGLSVHNKESKTVRTASGICHTGSVAAC